ncbi:MAG: hypothetical protein HYY37_06480 [Candidatus Aenigmarchaeota archaeon]|nr:hypothetical protein [Candidatus Aenigmarchaeota archaeon]
MKPLATIHSAVLGTAAAAVLVAGIACSASPYTSRPEHTPYTRIETPYVLATQPLSATATPMPAPSPIKAPTEAAAPPYPPQALHLLSLIEKHYPGVHRTITEQTWYQNGIDKDEALFVEALLHDASMSRAAAEDKARRGEYTIRPVSAPSRELPVLVTGGDEDAISRTYNNLPDALGCTERVLGEFPRETLLVTLGNYPGGAAGHPRTIMMHPAAGKEVMAHELTHLYVQQRGVPPWLDEAIAQAVPLSCETRPFPAGLYVPQGRLSAMPPSYQSIGGLQLMGALSRELGQDFPLFLRGLISRLNSDTTRGMISDETLQRYFTESAPEEHRALVAALYDMRVMGQ